MKRELKQTTGIGEFPIFMHAVSIMLELYSTMMGLFSKHLK